MDNAQDERALGTPGQRRARGVAAGVLLGALAGAGSMVLLAPRSGKKTRAKLLRATLTLRDQTLTGVDDALTRTRARAAQFAAGAREMAAELQQRGQAVLGEQTRRRSPVAEAGQKAVQGPLKS
jgi:gas vesicle protein